jgi:hypothetical protein
MQRKSHTLCGNRTSCIRRLARPGHRTNLSVGLTRLYLQSGHCKAASLLDLYRAAAFLVGCRCWAHGNHDYFPRFYVCPSFIASSREGRARGRCPAPAGDALRPREMPVGAHSGSGRCNKCVRTTTGNPLHRSAAPHPAGENHDAARSERAGGGLLLGAARRVGRTAGWKHRYCGRHSVRHLQGRGRRQA